MGQHGGVKVGFSSLDGGAIDIKNGAGRIDSKLAEMDKDLQPLRENWTGAAADAYAEAKQKWTASATNMREILEAIGRTVGTSSEDYQDGEHMNKARWQQ